MHQLIEKSNEKCDAVQLPGTGKGQSDSFCIGLHLPPPLNPRPCKNDLKQEQRNKAPNYLQLHSLSWIGAAERYKQLLKQSYLEVEHRHRTLSYQSTSPTRCSLDCSRSPTSTDDFCTSFCRSLLVPSARLSSSVLGYSPSSLPRVPFPVSVQGPQSYGARKKSQHCLPKKLKTAKNSGYKASSIARTARRSPMGNMCTSLTTY